MVGVVDAMFEVAGQIDSWLLYAVIAALAFGEAAAFLGLFVPGETTAVLGGLLAAQGRLSLAVLIVVVALGAIIGDSAGYEIGRRWGPRLLQTRVLVRHGYAVERSRAALVRWGGAAIFLGRWTSVLRACVPALAGMARMPYGRFLVANVLGGIAWAVAFTVLGYVAYESYERIEAVMGPVGWVVAAIVVAIGVLWLRGSHRREPGQPHTGEMTVQAGAAEARLTEPGDGSGSRTTATDLRRHAGCRDPQPPR